MTPVRTEHERAEKDGRGFATIFDRAIVEEFKAKWQPTADQMIRDLWEDLQARKSIVVRPTREEVQKYGGKKP